MKLDLSKKILFLLGVLFFGGLFFVVDVKAAVVKESCICTKIDHGKEIPLFDVQSAGNKKECLDLMNQIEVSDVIFNNCVWEMKTLPEGDIATQAKEKAEVLNPLNLKGVPDLFGRLVRIVMGVIGSIAFAMFIYGGFTWMIGTTTVAGGAMKADVNKAKGILVWSSLGLLVILSSYAIVKFIFEASLIK